MHTPSGTTRGERLAAWLEELGLADQLAAAGLPTFERVDGAVRWRDPLSGEELSPERLGELDDLLHDQGEERAHAVPLGLVQLRRAAETRAALLASPWSSYDGLAARQGVSVNAARFAAHRAAQRHALLLVQHEGATLIPDFQLTPDGEVRPELRAVLEPLLAAGVDPWRVWAWLTRPAGLLAGAVPHEAAADPDESASVRHAAVRLAERERPRR